MKPLLGLAIPFLLLSLFSLPCSAEPLLLKTRSRIESPKGSGHFEGRETTNRWEAKKTAIVICDMWDDHWCKGASTRVAEMAPAMNEAVKEARNRGVFIIHAPSETMEFYKDTPQRKRALDAPMAKAPVEIGRWTKHTPAKEGPFPIDDSDGGCDDIPRCKGGPPYPWKRQIAAIEITPEDAISDKGQEVYNLLQERGIENVMVMGVHANMCVLGRSFAIRQLVALGKNVLLVRDLTDTMYCSKMRPFVNHFRGTDLVIEHIEKYWAPSTTSTSLTGKPAFRFKEDSTPTKTAEASPSLLKGERPAAPKPGEGGAGVRGENVRGPTTPPTSPEDLAGNEQVREHIRKFKGRGQVTEPDVKSLTPQESLKQFTLADGLEIHLAVSEPYVRQPVSISFDERGRMWVVQYLQYPFPAGLKIIKYDEHLRAVFDKVPDPPPKHTPGADKVTIFEDKDGDGYYETHKDFITGLNIATSALVDRDGVWVMNPPYLLFYPDKNHDDVPDGPPEVHLSGFGLEDTHAVANSLTWGPDGWIYGAQGSTCTATVKGIHFLGQAIWRYHPGTHQFELYAEGGGNTFCVEFDAEGRLYSGTNWGEQRGLHYVQGGYYVKGWGKHGPLTNPHAYGFFNHMTHSGDKARFSHALIIYEGGMLPEKYFGRMFAAVPLQNRVQIAELPPDGSTYKTHDVDRAVQSADRWFRPVDIKAGPDGAIYLADWYDIRLTHVDPRDTWDRSNGRIYRITGKAGSSVKPVDLTKLSMPELIKSLSSSNKWLRQTARRVIAERNDPAIVPQLKNLVEGGNGQTALEALWTIHLLGGFDEKFALRQLDHKDPFVRLWTVRLLGDSRKVSRSVQQRLVELARYENSAQVRSQMASSAKRLPGRDALPIVAELLQRKEDASDPHIPLLLWWAIEDKAITDRREVLKLFGGASSWSSPLIAQYIIPRLVQRYASEGTESGLNVAASLIKNAPGSAERERLLPAIADAFKGRKIESSSAAFRTAVAAIDSKGKPENIALKVRLGAANSEESTRAYQVLGNDDEKLKAQRLELIAAFGESKDHRAIDPLFTIAKSSRWHSARKAALQALQQFDGDPIARRVLEIYPDLPRDQGVREAALDVLSKRKEWSLALLRSVDTKQITRAEVPFEVVQRLTLYKDRAIDELVRKNWGSLRQPPEQLQQRMRHVAEVARSGSGDLSRGKQLFASACATCHKLHGEGQSIGPDLTGYERDNLDFLLLSVIDPNAAIREEYTNFELETTDGLLLTGFITERAAQSVTIEDGQQGRTTIPKSRIKRLQASPTSRMPEGLLDALTDDQVRDLFAYLRTK